MVSALESLWWEQHKVIQGCEATPNCVHVLKFWRWIKMVEKTSLYRYHISKNHQDVRTWTCIHLKGRNSAHFIFSEKKNHVKKQICWNRTTQHRQWISLNHDYSNPSQGHPDPNVASARESLQKSSTVLGLGFAVVSPIDLFQHIEMEQNVHCWTVDHRLLTRWASLPSLAWISTEKTEGSRR